MEFINHLRGVIGFMQLPENRRRLVFYSEGKNYWPYLESLLREFLATTNIGVCYVSSDKRDPGLDLRQPNLETFCIGEGFVRNWFFENVATEVMILTMPDLGQYQVKRSRNEVHYIYLQHSLVSLHMAYRDGAFDYYDTIFCAGPHHVREMRAIEKQRDLPPRQLVEHGYSRLDKIIGETGGRIEGDDRYGKDPHVLIAPSWGEFGTIESGLGYEIVSQLLEQNYRVTLRPHPQTFLLSKVKIDEIVGSFGSHPLFECEQNIVGQESLRDSDIMISDWSGAALDYAFGFNKPVLFVDVPRKVNNPIYEQLGLTPLEVEIRNVVGSVIERDDCGNCVERVQNLLAREFDVSEIVSDHVFNVGRSAVQGCIYLRKLLGEI